MIQIQIIADDCCTDSFHSHLVAGTDLRQFFAVLGECAGNADTVDGSISNIKGCVAAAENSSRYADVFLKKLFSFRRIHRSVIAYISGKGDFITDRGLNVIGRAAGEQKAQDPHEDHQGSKWFHGLTLPISLFTAVPIQFAEHCPDGVSLQKTLLGSLSFSNASK